MRAFTLSLPDDWVVSVPEPQPDVVAPELRRQLERLVEDAGLVFAASTAGLDEEDHRPVVANVAVFVVPGAPSLDTLEEALGAPGRRVERWATGIGTAVKSVFDETVPAWVAGFPLDQRVVEYRVPAPGDAVTTVVRLATTSLYLGEEFEALFDVLLEAAAFADAHPGAPSAVGHLDHPERPTQPEDTS